MPRTSKPLLLLLLSFLASTAIAQTPATPPATSSPAVPTIQARTNLVVEDVVVTDKNGNPVHGLQATDFALAEKGAPQGIRHFEEHSLAPATPYDPGPPLPPGVFTNFAPPPTSAALNVLLLDTLNTPLEAQSTLREQLLKYIRTAPSGNRIAIFGLSTHLYLLQGFSSDPSVLKAAIDKKSLRSSQILDNPTTGGPTRQISDELEEFSGGGSAPSASAIASAAALVKQFEADQASLQLQIRARYTLDAMNQLARYLSALPGRKNLVWFSGSFPITIFPDLDLTYPFNVVADMRDDLRKTASLLTSAQVAVYPVDARGLFSSSIFDASTSGSQYARTPGRLGKDLQKFSEQTASENRTMYTLADQTGGTAFINTNGLADAVAKAINTGSNFYTLTYSPSDTHWNGAFRTIDLKLVGRFEHQSLRLSYRRGYFADDPTASASGDHPTSALSAGQADPRGAMRLAMAHGAPTPTELVFKVLALPATAASAEPETDLAKDNVANPGVKLAHGPYRRFHISFAAFPAQLLTRTAAGTYSGSIEFATDAYDADGNLLTAISETLKLNLPPETFSRIAHGSLPFQQVVSVPVKGDLFLRIGIHDLVTNRVGALEIPVSAIKNLPPQPLPASAPTQPRKATP